MHLAGFLEPAALGSGSGLEACNSINKVADRIYRCVAGTNAKFIIIVNDGRECPARVRLRQIKSKHMRRERQKDFIRDNCQLTKTGDDRVTGEMAMLRQLTASFPTANPRPEHGVERPTIPSTAAYKVREPT